MQTQRPGGSYNAHEVTSGTVSPTTASGCVSPILTRNYTSQSYPGRDPNVQWTSRSTRKDGATERTRLLDRSVQESAEPPFVSPQSPNLSKAYSRATSRGTRPLSRSTSFSYRWDTPSPGFLLSGVRRPLASQSCLSDSRVIEDQAWYNRLRNSFGGRSMIRSVRGLDRIGRGEGWYDQFTSTDWVHDAIADGYRALELRKRKGFRGRLWLMFDAAQGWILMAIIGLSTAVVAYVIDVAEATVYDLKRGYCRTDWRLNRRKCCATSENCDTWRTWSQVFSPGQPDDLVGDFIPFVLGCVFFASIAFFLTNLSKTVVPIHVGSTLDRNLSEEGKSDSNTEQDSPVRNGVMAVYSAAGSGVAEVKVILSGFVLHGYLGVKTLVIKCPALLFSVASGMSLGKEGPYVHIAACIGNVFCRIFPKYRLNDAKRREVLSAAAAVGVAVAFGSPFGGLLFSLEEVSYYFPPKTLFRTFFCCIVAAVTLRFLNPYGTNKIALFEVRYLTQWRFFELFLFVFLGVVGGLAGAGFIKASRFWATKVRKLGFVKANPWFEVSSVALLTGLISFWNAPANLPVAELLLQVASPCDTTNLTGLCPRTKEDIPGIIGHLSITFVIKAFLTVITFGIKVPAGIYVPSMVCGGILGRIVGHGVQYVLLSLPTTATYLGCSSSNSLEHCITPGVYALVTAGAIMCGVTRLSVTLAVILFELTGSLDYALPFAIGVLAARWVADMVEPHSIYDLLIDMNSYPFMDNRHTPLFDNRVELGDIVPHCDSKYVIDISISPLVRASDLRAKLRLLQDVSEVDSGLPVVRNQYLAGCISAPDLEYALDHIITPEESTWCLLSYVDDFPFPHGPSHRRWFPVMCEDDNVEDEDRNRDVLDSSETDSERDARDSPEQMDTQSEEDFVPFVDLAPVSLEIHSPLSLVYQCFSKLGLRYICVVEAGQFRGMLHKKHFVKFIKNMRDEWIS